MEEVLLIIIVSAHAENHHLKHYRSLCQKGKDSFSWQQLNFWPGSSVSYLHHPLWCGKCNPVKCIEGRATHTGNQYFNYYCPI